MMNRSALSVAALLVVCGGTCVPVLAATPNDANRLAAVGQTPIERLQAAYPGVRTFTDAGRLLYVYGKPMTSGPTAQAAVDAFLAQYIGVFGIAAADLTQTSDFDMSGGKFTGFWFKQSIDGVPVEYGNGRILVLNPRTAGESYRVVYVAGTFAERPEGGFAADTLNADAAKAKAQQFHEMQTWSEPTLVIHQGDGQWQDARRAWKVQGTTTAVGIVTDRHTMFIDAATGELLRDRDEIMQVDHTGTVRAYATPGVWADASTNPPVLTTIPDIRVTRTGGNNAFTNSSGVFQIPFSGTAAGTLTTNVSSGRWVNVNPVGLTEQSASISNTPGSAATITLNPTPSGATTAQINAFIHTQLTRDYFRTRTGPTGLSGLDIVLPANTGVSGSCNAYFDGGSINFFNAGGGCNNTAFSTVIAHEYGHFVVQALGLGQGGFGEGFADSVAILLYDDGIVGRGFSTNGGAVRNIDQANQQYPCNLEIHTCGQIVAGVWRDLRLNFQGLYGTASLELARQLHVDWSLITTGGTGSNFVNSAHPGTPIEVITADDNDGDITNGSPNYTPICAAFSKHNITCPSASGVDFSYPNGRPANVAPGESTALDVTVVSAVSSPESGSGKLFARVGGVGSYVEVPRQQLGTNQYRFTLPPAQCGQTIEYYITAKATTGGVNYEPLSAPSVPFTALAGVNVTTVAALNSESISGFSASANGASSGAWQSRAPIAAGAGDPAADYDGSGKAWVTDNRAGFDVDGGPVQLFSPTFNLSGYSRAVLSYARWLTCDTGEDRMQVDISSDGGTTWQPLETVAPTAGWQKAEFELSSIIPLTSSVRVRYSVNDPSDNSITEGAVDAINLFAYQCPQACAADFNADGFLDFTDFDLYVAAFEAGNPSADFNADGFLDFTDFDDFVSAFEAGC
ncbi:MAG: GC-type dockerin domain-anchored protein [Planctomycetota bacterium]|nr:GC-type dockerin domain-anchored protein [Planctomycetota bacterium]